MNFFKKYNINKKKFLPIIIFLIIVIFFITVYYSTEYNHENFSPSPSTLSITNSKNDSPVKSKYSIKKQIQYNHDTEKLFYKIQGSYPTTKDVIIGISKMCDSSNCSGFLIISDDDEKITYSLITNFNPPANTAQYSSGKYDLYYKDNEKGKFLY
jgi:hypothetical protein